MKTPSAMLQKFITVNYGQGSQEDYFLVSLILTGMRTSSDSTLELPSTTKATAKTHKTSNVIFLRAL